MVESTKEEKSPFLQDVEVRPAWAVPKESFKERIRRNSCHWIAWCVLVIAYLALLIPYVSVFRRQNQVGFPNPANAPVEYTLSTLRSNLWEGDTASHDDPFAAGSDEYWNSLLDVGLIRLTPEEAKQLPVETDAVHGEPQYHAGNLEVFHQLHCLNRLRRMYFFPETNELNETQEFHHRHAIHCFAYLEQVVRCHADVGVMSVRYHPEGDFYMPVWNVTKTCRNFDKIHDWAKSRSIE